jgi:hypothetical protein
MTEEISVFQDLTIHGCLGGLPAIRKALLDQAIGPWHHAKEKEEIITINSDSDDVVVFTRDKEDGVEAVALVLWSANLSYKVTNIVPRDVSELGYEAYNQTLKDFVSRIVKPASKQVDFKFDLTSEQQSLNDWVCDNVAQELRRFSKLANKSTGSAHPSDRQRWLDFILLSHRSKTKLDTELLVRWLIESQKWADDKAYDLATQYEFGLELLNKYDRS